MCLLIDNPPQHSPIHNWSRRQISWPMRCTDSQTSQLTNLNAGYWPSPHGVLKSSTWTQLVYIFIFERPSGYIQICHLRHNARFPQPNRKPSYVDLQLNDLGEWVLLFNPMNKYELYQWWGYDSLLINTLWVQNILYTTNLCCRRATPCRDNMGPDFHDLPPLGYPNR